MGSKVTLDQAGRKLGRTQHSHWYRLEQVEQNRLVEERVLVIVRSQPIPRHDQLTRGFCVVRLVRVPECRRSKAPEENRKQQERPADKP